MDNSGRKICRLCLYEPKDFEENPLINLFEKLKYANTVEKIETCLKIKLSHSDTIPPLICHSCEEKVNYFNDFLELCSKSEKQLERLYGLANLEQNHSNTSQVTDHTRNSVNWFSEERTHSADKIESDYSVNYKMAIQEWKPKKSTGKKGLCIKSRKSSVMLMTQSEQTKEKLYTLKSSKSSSSFTCKFCKKTFSNIYDHQKHVKKYHEETTYKCEICDKLFTNLIKCQDHEKNHKLACKICNMQVLAKNMGAHLYKHAEKFRTKPRMVFKAPSSGPNHNKKITCHICHKTFKSENAMSAHMKKSHVGKQIRFSANKKRRANKPQFKIRLQRLMKARSYKCKFCGNQFSVLKELQQHMAEHSKMKKKCPKCRKQFIYKTHFDKHIFHCFYAPSHVTLKRTASMPTAVNLVDDKIQ